MTPHHLVEELGRRLNTPLALDKAGLARILVDGTLAVDFEFDEPNGRLLIYSVIGILPTGRARERFFERLLTANLFGAETGPCSPAFDAERNETLLWFAVGEDGNIEEVIAALENLVGRSEHWRAELVQAQAVDPELEPEPAESGGFESFVRA